MDEHSDASKYAGHLVFCHDGMFAGPRIFQVQEVGEIVVHTLLHYRDRGAYALHEFVVMPDHVHIVLTPSESMSLEKVMQLIKGGSSHRIHRQREHHMEIWQAGFYDWTIRDVEDWRVKTEYIRQNPVRAGLVEKAEDWKFSSAGGRFGLDQIPEKYLKVASGAKAPFKMASTRGLKPPPPKENATAALTLHRDENAPDAARLAPPKKNITAVLNTPASKKRAAGQPSRTAREGRV